MNQSKQFDLHALAAHLRFLINAKCNPNVCKVSNNDTAIIIHGGIAKMIPHTVIVIVYQFAMDYNLMMYFDTDDARFVLH